VTHLGVYTPSSEALQAAIATLLALEYSFCKELSTLELLQASNLQRNQYLSLGIIWVPLEIHIKTLLVPHDLQYLKSYPYVFPPPGMQTIDNLFCSTSSTALLIFL
jgi:hypothetical protein